MRLALGALARGGMVTVSAPLLGGPEGEREIVVPLDTTAPVHTAEAHDAITAELVACTLGQRRHADRLELRTDLTGQVLHAARTIRRALKPVRSLMGAPGGDRTPDHPRVRRMLYR